MCTFKTRQAYFINWAMLKDNYPKAEAIKWSSMNGFICLASSSTQILLDTLQQRRIDIMKNLEKRRKSSILLKNMAPQKM